MSGNLLSNGTAISKDHRLQKRPYIDTPGGTIRPDEGVPQPFPWGASSAW